MARESGRSSKRHCERSEAIQENARQPLLDCFVALRAPRNDAMEKSP
jgi:hypothetical protein